MTDLDKHLVMLNSPKASVRSVAGIFGVLIIYIGLDLLFGMLAADASAIGLVLLYPLRRRHLLGDFRCTVGISQDQAGGACQKLMQFGW